MKPPFHVALVSLVALFFSIEPLWTSATDKISIADLPQHAIQQSQITLPGAPPFHLRARIVEATNPENDKYKAEIEEYWLSPDKWKRIVKADNFSQTLVVNGEKVREELTGDYYPNWLRTLVNAIFDPGAPLHGIEMAKSSDNPMIGGTLSCRRFAFRVGISPVSNRVFSSFCFEGGLLDSVGVSGYHAGYKNYEKFAGKEVARKVREYIQPGEEVEASIEELGELHNAEESLFAVQGATPQLQVAQVSEATVRELAIDAPPMQWPTIHGGKVSGVLSIYVCIDRNGRVRETYALNSDHPDMSDAAQKQVQNWRFKTATSNGVPIQVESILTFAYETRIAQ